MKPALLVIDMQTRFYHRNNAVKESYEAAFDYINYAIGLFRQKNLPIFAILHQDKEENLTPDAKDFEMHETIKLNDSDIRIIKEYGNAFVKTPLLEKLKEVGADTLILTGFCAENCVLSTYRGAEDHDLKPILFKGSLASGTPENIRFVENISAIMSYRPLEILLSIF